jgi:hypothetical protein
MAAATSAGASPPPAVVTCTGCGATFDVRRDGIDFTGGRRGYYVTWACPNPECLTANDADLEL